ncbi:MAG: hypothetical protein LBR77_06150 [Lachnospiraceae bacterium]|jgi:hypothetical protein|nr:hypothetical protein [Lachnospiraceae bacterium]
MNQMIQKASRAVRKAWKRAVSTLMSATMVASLFTGVQLATGVGTMTAMAFELPYEELGEGHSDVTAYIWKWASGADESPSPTWRFDFRGFSTGTQNSYGTASIQTSFNHAGWPIYMAIAANQDTPAPPPAVESTTTSPSNSTSVASYNSVSPFDVAEPGGYGHHTYSGTVWKFNPVPSDGTTATANGNVERHTFSGFTKKTTDTYTDIDLEMKVTTTPSEDGQVIYVDYYVYDYNGKASPTGTTLYLGSSNDIQIDGNDAAPTYKDSDRIRMMNPTSRAVFELITTDPTRGITPPTTRATGPYSQMDRDIFTNNGAAAITGGVDTGAAYSWTIQIYPYQTIHRRVAYAVRGASYYVSQSAGNDSWGNTSQGMMNYPYQTIQAAIDAVGNRKGFIYIYDYANFTAADAAALTVTANTGTDITFTSSNYKLTSTTPGAAGLPYTVTNGADPGYLQTITRDPSYTGPFFDMNNRPSIMRFTDLVFDGGGVATADPIIKATTGSVHFLRGVSIVNTRGTAASLGSGASITGSANFTLNGGGGEINAGPFTDTVNGVSYAKNVTDGLGVIHFDSTGTFSAVGTSKISGNTKSDGTTKNNLYLGAGRHIEVTNDLLDSEIGVTTATDPAASVGGAISAAAQEVLVAVPKSGTGGYPGESGLATSPFAVNFYADKDPGDQSTYYSTAGSNVVGNKKNTVIRKNGYTVTYAYIDNETGLTASISAAYWATLPHTGTYSAGDAIAVNNPNVETDNPGLALTSVVIEQAPYSSLTWDSVTASATYGKVTGTMPATDITITYNYDRVSSSISFVSNGGTPSPAALNGTAGSPVIGLWPTTNRYGYTFNGWATTNPASVAGPYTYVTAFPATFPNTPVTYYAHLTPNTSVKFDYTVTYQNANGSITFQSNTVPSFTYVTDTLYTQMKAVPGYKWDGTTSGVSFTTPSTYDYTGSGAVAVGTFNTTSPPPSSPYGDFNGSMPAMDTTVTFGYQVDTSVTKNLVVNHKTASGVTISPTVTTPFSAEASISATKVTLFGYDFVKAEITTGYVANTTDSAITPPAPHLPVAALSTAVTGNFDPATGLVWNPSTLAAVDTFTGVMPNQDVVIDFIYAPNGSGYNLNVNYQDNNTTDTRLHQIMPRHSENHMATDIVGYTFLPIYGYLNAMNASFPDTLSPSTVGSFNASRDLSVPIFPTQNVNATYNYDRDASLWVTLTYGASTHGHLDNLAPVSTDVTPQPAVTSATNYYVDVLRDDGSAAAADPDTGAYTWTEINTKHLVPTPTADQYYMFEGWFIDADGDGVRGASEPLLAGPEVFTAGANVVANFVEDPAWWIDVYFNAASHGAITTGQPTSLHTTRDRLFGSILKPTVTPEVNYLFEGWYKGSTATTASTPLANGDMFTAHFYKDPIVWGTNVQPPVAGGLLDTDGDGRVTVYDTDVGYTYIVTDMSGNIVGVGTGDITGRLNFDDLLPGTRYNVYEATGDAVAVVGNDISTVTATAISTPTNVRTPVVDGNYQVQYDDAHPGKTKIVIEPADPDADYGLLLPDGTVVYPPEVGSDGWETPSGAGPTVIFSDLDFDQDYVVVARKKGDTGTSVASKFPDGDVITTDPGGPLDVPVFIVETRNGTVDTVNGALVSTTRYTTALEGDTVVITAPATNGAGEPFAYWRLLTGQIDGMSSRQTTQTVTFTQPATNLTWAAYYTRAAATPSVADVTDEVRGGNPGDFGLDPDDQRDLQDLFTTPADQVLMDVNGADVTYKVIYNKNTAKASEISAIKSSGLYDMGHQTAFKTAWGLDIIIERYVNNRLVGVASPSNATFTTYVQLDAEDVDQMDYQLYQIDSTGGVTLVWLEAMSDDPEQTAGLFSFTAQAFCRYVMVYNKAFRIYFTNNNEVPIYRYNFKVRKGEAPSDSYYTFEYGLVEIPLAQYVDANGVQFDYQDWSYSDTALQAFDEDRAITKKTYIYANYKDNKDQVDAGRKDIEDLLDALAKMADDFFLKMAESEEVKDIIRQAHALLDKTGPKATLAEIAALIGTTADLSNPPTGTPTTLLGTIGKYAYEYDYQGVHVNGKLYERYNKYYGLQETNNAGGLGGGGGQLDAGGTSLWGGPSTGDGATSASAGASSPGGSSGRSSSSGGGGSSSSGSGGRYAAPTGSYIPTPARNYTVGTNGNWELLEGTTDQWIFTLNGGIRLTSRWAKLDWASGETEKNGWYHFNSRGIMDSGWFKDEAGFWYYAQTDHDGFYGKMKTGWHKDETDGHWYYLDPETGVMFVGWHEIDGKWYYFAQFNFQDTYVYNAQAEAWEYAGLTERPYGSMYANEHTPDGYTVDQNGAWVQ